MSVSRWLGENEATILASLADLIAIPSISTQSAFAPEVRRCADWLAAELRRIGFEAEAVPTARHPVVIGEWRNAPGAPTMLLYGHYDVQPPEPLDQWTSPPFSATVRDGRLYARGAADDKGQLWIHLKALEAHLATSGALPLNVVILVEGEEEVGSKSLPALLQAQRERLACDVVVISDTPMFAPGIPNILASMRGMAYFEVSVTGASGDLHSGQYGGVAPNAVTALARILATLHETDGRVAILGFYDGVSEPTKDRRKELARLPLDDTELARGIGVSSLIGEPGYSTLERLWARPTCEVNGIQGGYTGEGPKTVIPSNAFAKVSFRLVGQQTPEKTERLFRDHLARVSQPGVRLDVRRLHGALPWTARDTNSPAMAAARRALATAFDHDAIVGGSGGTIPVLSELVRVFEADVLLIGFGLPGENAHAPNEWLDLDNFRRGMRAMSSLYGELAHLQSKDT